MESFNTEGLRKKIRRYKEQPYRNFRTKKYTNQNCLKFRRQVREERINDLEDRIL